MDNKLTVILEMMQERMKSGSSELQKLFWLMRSCNDRSAITDYIEGRLGTEDVAYLLYNIMDPVFHKLRDAIDQNIRRLPPYSWELAPGMIDPLLYYDSDNWRGWKTMYELLRYWCRFCANVLETRGALDNIALSEETKDQYVEPAEGPKYDSRRYYSFDYIQMLPPEDPLRERADLAWQRQYIGTAVMNPDAVIRFDPRD